MEIPKGTPVVGYVRVSTPQQVQHGLGLEVQREQIEKFCTKRGLELLRIYEDPGLTGDTLDRPGLQEMLASLSEVKFVVVPGTSRLWRGDIAKGIIKKSLIEAGVEIVSIENPSYTVRQTDPTEYLLNAIMEALDVFMRLETIVKLKRARTKKAKNGHKAGGTCPLGYRYNSRKEVEIHPEEVDSVREIFSAFLLTRSEAQALRVLAAKGITTRRGQPFTRQALCFVLMNDFYTGLVTWRGEKIPGQHPPLVDKATFRRVQAIYATPRRRRRPGFTPLIPA